jgi:hypothetical protein
MAFQFASQTMMSASAPCRVMTTGQSSSTTRSVTSFS